VKIWPAEEVLANFLIKNAYLFENKKILELGAGKSGLAAIALAIKLKEKLGKIVVSDGNEEC
jgi:predicted nicotinamide N-methyase